MISRVLYIDVRMNDHTECGRTVTLSPSGRGGKEQTPITKSELYRTFFYQLISRWPPKCAMEWHCLHDDDPNEPHSAWL